jgi:ArsR family transcriptional regulator, arsenate/arsenite/antimonite-responsive transcriptional repressor
MERGTPRWYVDQMYPPGVPSARGSERSHAGSRSLLIGLPDDAGFIRCDRDKGVRRTPAQRNVMVPLAAGLVDSACFQRRSGEGCTDGDNVSRYVDASAGRSTVMEPGLAFDALADPARREMLGILARHEECSAGELAAQITWIGRTAVSSHLRVLRSAGLVRERRSGRYRFYSIDPSGSARDVLRLLHELFQTGLSDLRESVEDRRGVETGADDAEGRSA